MEPFLTIATSKYSYSCFQRLYLDLLETEAPKFEQRLLTFLTDSQFTHSRYMLLKYVEL